MPINPAFVYQNFFGPPSNCHPLNHAGPDIDCYDVDGRQLDLDGLIAAPPVFRGWRNYLSLKLWIWMSPSR